ncbi:putative peptidylprolyl isomerase [Helianthus annuus]|nr:putative peptidylprolyl isomerase [Helianthus annuus]KAJ0554407.1 putative peptidylprolyl isomerase [Helianthus annuus]
MKTLVHDLKILLVTVSRTQFFYRAAETKKHVVKKSTGKITKTKMIPRRLLLHSFGFIPVLLNVPLIAEALEMNEPEVIRTQKLDSGVRIQDIIDGEGKEAREGDLVEVNYVCRRSNGYFVHSTVDQFSGESSPVILPLNEKEIIKGLKEVIIGMKAGGKRRALIPPSVGYVKENLGPIPDEFGPRRSLLSHVKEPLIFEVQLLKVL